MVVPCVAGMGEDLRHVCRKFNIRVTPNPVEGDIAVGKWQRTGATVEGGCAHPDNTHRKMLQSRWTTGCCD